MPVAKQDNIVFPQKDFPLMCSQTRSRKAMVSLWHEILEFKLIIDGSVTMMIDTQTVTAGPGDIIFINPYEVHSNLIIQNEVGTYHLFMLDLDYFRAVGSEMLDLRSIFLEERIRFRNLIRNRAAADILHKIAEE